MDGPVLAPSALNVNQNTVSQIPLSRCYSARQRAWAILLSLEQVAG